MKGCYLVHENKNEKFDIQCELRQGVTEIPDIEKKLYGDVESACSVIKSLNGTTEEVKRKYFNKLLSLAQVGLVPEDGAQPEVAGTALERLKEEIIIAEGRRIKNQYMKRLGIDALILGVLMIILRQISAYCFKNEFISMFATTWIGTMIGTWISYGARKFEIEFKDLAVIEKDMMDPWIRLIYIGLATFAFEMFFMTGIITVSIGKISTADISGNYEIQLVIGLICGLVESRIGVNIYKKAKSAIGDTENS